MNTFDTKDKPIINHPNKSLLSNFLDYELSEKDFYPPEDKRVFCSKVGSIFHGDNFNDYLKDYYNLCDMENIFE